MSTTKLPVLSLQWVDTHEASNEELAAFARDANLLPADTEFLLEGLQRPEIAFRSEYTLMLIHVPVFNKRTRVTSGAALAFIATDTHLYTLHEEPIVTLERIRKDMEENPEKHEEAVGNTPLSLALYIMNQLTHSSFRKLTRLAKHIDIAEDAVFFGNERKMVEEIAVLGRDVLDFRRIVRPHIHLFDELPAEIDENTAAAWKRLGSQMRQMWELLESLNDSAKELRTTNDALLQHKENELLRMLSLYSIIVIPIWVFVTPYDPRGSFGDAVIFWTVLGALALALLFIYIRAKRRKVL